MQHKKSYQTIIPIGSQEYYRNVQIKEYITLLKKMRCMSAAFLMRRYKLTQQGAINILKDIVDNFENVKFCNDYSICIENADRSFCIKK